MGKPPSDRHDDPDFIFYPTNKVVGIIDDPADAKAALRDLRAAGFTADEIEVLTGEEGAHRIDPTGGFAPKVLKSTYIWFKCDF